MKKNGFLHVLLIVALCFSQLAATVHVAGHLELSSTEVHPNSDHRHTDFHRHYGVQPHADSLLQGDSLPHTIASLRPPARPEYKLPGSFAAQDQPQKAHVHAAIGRSSVNEPGNTPHNHGLFGSDCAAYHAYIGLSFCLFGASCSNLAPAEACARFTPLQAGPVAATTYPGLPIRAPPMPA